MYNKLKSVVLRVKILFSNGICSLTPLFPQVFTKLYQCQVVYMQDYRNDQNKISAQFPFLLAEKDTEQQYNVSGDKCYKENGARDWRMRIHVLGMCHFIWKRPLNF